MWMVYPCWLAILILLVVGLLSGIRGISEERIRRRLRREGIETEAVVIGHWVMGSAYYVKYRYYHKGQCYKREERVGSSRYEAWPWGTVISVRYLPECPDVARITSEGNHLLARAVITVTFVVFVIVLALLLA